MGVITGEEAIAYGLVGPNLRASGVDFDVRRDEPYSVYDRFDFGIPVGSGVHGATGDGWRGFKQKEFPAKGWAIEEGHGDAELLDEHWSSFAARLFSGDLAPDAYEPTDAALRSFFAASCSGTWAGAVSSPRVSCFFFP